VSSTDQKTNEKRNELIEGATIELALVAARCFGNCAIDQDEVVETPEAWFYNAHFIDLETGFTTTRKFRQSRKHMVFGRMDEERKETIRFEIGQSKAIRNVILNALPSWLIKNALQQAKQGVLIGIQRYVNKNGIEAAQKVILDRLAQYQVTEAMILMKLERETVKGLTVEDLVLLQGDAKALETGEETVGSLFGDQVKEPKSGPMEGPKTGTEQAKEQLRQARQSRQTAAPKKTDAPVYATLEQTDELRLLAAERGWTEQFDKMFAHTDPDKVLFKQYEDVKANLLRLPLLPELQQDGATEGTSESTSETLPEDGILLGE
jgi:hypothetical protein